MKLFFHHVGQKGADEDFKKTVYKDVSIETVESNVPSSVPIRSEILHRLSTDFPAGRFNCWGVPAGAKSVIRQLEEGDFVLLVESAAEYGQVPVLCHVRAFWSDELRNLSLALWGSDKYPFIFFFRTEQLTLSWSELTEHLDYKPNFDPRGNFYSVKSHRLDDSGGVEGYIKYLRENHSIEQDPFAPITDSDQINADPTEKTLRRKQELERRINMWKELVALGGPTEVTPGTLNKLGIYYGGRGIWVDKERTRNLTDNATGVTVGLLHTGKSYDDDLSADGMRYHYPNTKRPGHDLAEINATKAAQKIGLPVFAVTHSGSRRNVYLGLVEDWDDSDRVFLITFSENVKALKGLVSEEPFMPTEKNEVVWGKVAKRPNQQRFKFLVTRRYGNECAVCGITIKQVLEAAHLIPKKPSNNKGGSDDPRNGLVLCATHHRALDGGLFAIEPASLKVTYRSSGPDSEALRINRQTIDHLSNKPDKVALEWRWSNWKG